MKKCKELVVNGHGGGGGGGGGRPQKTLDEDVQGDLKALNIQERVNC